MSFEKHLDQYVGDVVGGLLRESATMKTRCLYLESVVEGLRREINLRNESATESPATKRDVICPSS